MPGAFYHAYGKQGLSIGKYIDKLLLAMNSPTGYDILDILHIYLKRGKG
jgi:hypothetical protein